MIEIPESKVLAAQLRSISPQTVKRVYPPTKRHGFAWFNGDSTSYDDQLNGRELISAKPMGIYVDIEFDGGRWLAVDDGVNMRYHNDGKFPKDYQLLIEFADATGISFNVAMYGGITLHDKDYDNPYYLKSKTAVFADTDEFTFEYFNDIAQKSKQTLSLKAFLATEQRFPGIANGVLQDILFYARLNPKSKLFSLNGDDLERLYDVIKKLLPEIARMGGRDTEKDLFGKAGGYKTVMSKNGLKYGCPACGGEIKKEAYLGGSVYYCPVCQPIVK